jgi:hypothetical protein
MRRRKKVQQESQPLKPYFVHPTPASPEASSIEELLWFNFIYQENR